jgi:hypothetical protein
MELLKSNQLAQLLKPPSGEDCNGVTPTAAIQGIDFANLQFEGVASVLGGGKGLAEAKNLPSVPSGEWSFVFRVCFRGVRGGRGDSQIFDNTLGMHACMDCA